MRWHKLSFFSLLGNRIIQDALAEIRILDHVYTWLFCEFTGEPQWAFLSVDKETNSCLRVRPLLFKKLVFSNFSRLSDHTFTKRVTCHADKFMMSPLKFVYLVGKLMNWTTLRTNQLDYICALTRSSEKRKRMTHHKSTDYRYSLNFARE